MTACPDARTPSADVHALSGSSAGPGLPFAPLAAVHELPDPFVPLGTAAAGVASGLAARRAAAAHPDAEVIDLAGRVERLNARELKLWRWTATIQDALAALRLHEQERGLFRGLPYWTKLRERATSRLERWGLQLAGMRPATHAGLAAKAAAAAAVVESEELPDDWRQKLAISLSRDVVRLAARPNEATDPFTGYHGEIEKVRAAVHATEENSPEQEAAWARWRELDALVLASRPTTLAGAVGALEIARREHHQFSIQDCRDEDVGTDDRLIQHTLDGALAVLRGMVMPADAPERAQDLATPADAAAMEFEPWPDPCPTADLRRTMGEHLNTVVLGWGVCNSTKPKLVASLENAMAVGEGHLFGKLKADLDSTAEFLEALSNAVESASARLLVAASVIGTDPRHAGIASDPFGFDQNEDATPLPVASAA